jgi:hypothetical protein
MAPNKIIIDTDPVSKWELRGNWEITTQLTNEQGIDDILAMLLAFSAKPEELDILMLSLTFGNVEVQKYVYHTSRDELSWTPTLVTCHDGYFVCNIFWNQELNCHLLQLPQECRHSFPPH